MFLNLCKFGKSLLFPCKFVLLSAYCRQINVLSTPQPKPSGNISPGAVCSAPRGRQLHFSRGLHERVREMLKADGMKKVWVLWEKLLQVQVVAGPGGSDNIPLGTRKPSQILGGPERGRLSSAGLCKVSSQRNPSNLHQATTLLCLAHSAEPSGSQAHLKEPHCSGF